MDFDPCAISHFRVDPVSLQYFPFRKPLKNSSFESSENDCDEVSELGLKLGKVRVYIDLVIDDVRKIDEFEFVPQYSAPSKDRDGEPMGYV